MTTQSPIKIFLDLFCFAYTLGLLPCLCRCKNLIYTTTLSEKTFHLFWVKAPVSQGRPAPLCSETARPISHKNEWFDEFFFAYLWFISPYAPFLATSYIPLSWNKETPLVKSNFLSSQMKSHSCSPSSLPLHKAKWVQLNGKTLQVLKNSLV